MSATYRCDSYHGSGFLHRSRLVGLHLLCQERQYNCSAGKVGTFVVYVINYVLSYVVTIFHL